jgi:uncharacterized tellurite resistance protein B-like protein
MNPATGQREPDNPEIEPAVAVRNAVDTLHTLDSETIDHLNALAFVLVRVAWADGRVCDDERRRMESILVEHARVCPEHAVLVTEIACHRAELSDCGIAYGISRGLRTRLEMKQRASIIGLLTAVADADGRLRSVERHEIAQIAGELGIHPGEVWKPE